MLTRSRHLFPMVRSPERTAITTGPRTPHGSSWIQTTGSQSAAASAESVSGRIAALLCQNDSAMVAAARCPCSVDLVEVSDIEGIERPTLGCGQMEVLLIFAADHSGVGSSDNVDSAGSKTPNDVAVHSILVYVQTKEAHSGYARAGKICSTTASSAAMSVSISSRLAW